MSEQRMTSAPPPPDAVSLPDYERLAQGRVSNAVWSYVNGASADGLTMRWNREAFDRLRLAGRLFADMRGASTGCRVLGLDLGHPVMVAPMGWQKLVHPGGELATVLGAGAAGALMCVGAMSTVTLEQAAAEAHGPLWFQLYMQADRADTLKLVRRATDAGYRAIVVTGDAPVNGVRNMEQRAGFTIPAGVEAVNLRGMHAPDIVVNPGESPVFRGMLDHAPRMDDIRWLREQTALPLLVKGVTHPDDAEALVRLGVNGLIVSNHGGRALDTLPASLHALQAVAARAAGRVPVLMDGGIRRGTDVLKALACGADAIMIGRPVLHGLIVAGAVGVAHVLTILKAELEVAMALTGCLSIDSIGPAALWDS